MNNNDNIIYVTGNSLDLEIGSYAMVTSKKSSHHGRVGLIIGSSIKEDKRGGTSIFYTLKFSDIESAGFFGTTLMPVRMIERA